jgi:hypothetical protein
MRIVVAVEVQQSALILLRDAGVRAGGAIIHEGQRAYGVLTVDNQKEIERTLQLLAGAGIKAETIEP